MTFARVDEVDRQGLRLTVPPGAEDVVVDVLLDERRVWSFWVLRDSKETVDGHRVEWPAPLRPYLDGVSRLMVREHVSGRLLHDDEHRFGTAGNRIAVVNGAGLPLGIDKSGRLAQTFDTRSAEHVEPLLDAVEQVLAVLEQLGIDAFLAYGTLLGAVREGRLIGHDSDADLGYVSRHRDPVDVVRESFALQRHLTELGYTVHRYSGAAFLIDVTESDGSVRGLDLFGGYMDGETLFLMGEVGAPFRPDWIRPLGRADLEGRSLPVPAHPERLLEAMYGPSWRVPDPAYQFSTPPWVQRALNGWFRGTRVHRNEWARRYSSVLTKQPANGRSDLAALVLECEPHPGRVLDLGAGRGRDALWLARQGLEVTAYDFLPHVARPAVATAHREGLQLEVQELNLNEWRSVLAAGAAEAHRPGPRTLMARHLADCTTAFGRDSLWRLSSMSLRSGGRLYVENWVDGDRAQFVGQRRLSTDQVSAELISHGARILETSEHDVATTPEEVDQNTETTRSRSSGPPRRTIGRVVAQWHD